MPAALTENELKRIQNDLDAQLPDRANRLTVSYTSDGQGGMVETWGTATENVRCKLVTTQQAGREAVAGAALQSFRGYTLILPHDTTVTAADRWEVNDITYAVISVDSGKSNPFVLRLEVQKL